MTNEHLRNLADRLDVDIALYPFFPPEGSQTQIVENIRTGRVSIRLIGQGAATPEGYFSVLHELGHADYLRTHGAPEDTQYERDLVWAHENGAPYPPPPPHILAEEAYATRWAIANAEPGFVVPVDYTLEAMETYYDHASPETLQDERVADFLALYVELGGNHG